MNHHFNMIDLAPVKTEVDQFLYEFQEVKITSQDEYTNAGDLLKQIQNKIKKLEDKRKEYTQPLDESKKRIMADFKSISEPLEEFVSNVKSKMVEWYRIEQARLDEEQKKIEAAALAKAKEEHVSEVVVPVINTQVKTQRGDVSTTTVKKVWKWKVTDENAVTRDYLCVDGDKVSDAVKEGNRNIPGIEIYQEEQISIR